MDEPYRLHANICPVVLLLFSFFHAQFGPSKLAKNNRPPPRNSHPRQVEKFVWEHNARSQEWYTFRGHYISDFSSALAPIEEHQKAHIAWIPPSLLCRATNEPIKVVFLLILISSKCFYSPSALICITNVAVMYTSKTNGRPLYPPFPIAHQ
jgi:hypothetical protein